jgi:Arc/MetJ family transcription regulator
MTRHPVPVMVDIYSGHLLYIPLEVLMTKRLIELDDDLLAEAGRQLNTTGVSETVREALRQSAAIGARMRQIEWMRAGGMAELADKDVRRSVWR